MIATICGLEAFLLARYGLRRLRRRPTKHLLSRPSAVVLHVLVGIGMLCVLYGYFIEPYWIEVNSLVVRTPKLQSGCFRIVQISDLHCDRKPRNEERAVRIINDLKPDVIVATGDYLNDTTGRTRLTEMLSDLRAPLGKFAVNGNFEIDYWPGVDLLAGTGFRLLNGDSVTVTKGSEEIALTGLGLDRAGAYREVLETLPNDRFVVFLFHKPDLIEDVNGLGIDLYVCGHTHGGQVALPGYGALLTFSKFGKKYESGLYRCGGTTLYVNRGLGLEPGPAPQVRFCARPEVTVFDILPTP